MVDSAQVAPESETPVNPYSLLEAVNRSSDKAQGAWLIFLAVMTYVTVAVAGVTHEALLLETPVQLPILQQDLQTAPDLSGEIVTLPIPKKALPPLKPLALSPRIIA